MSNEEEGKEGETNEWEPRKEGEGSGEGEREPGQANAKA